MIGKRNLADSVEKTVERLKENTFWQPDEVMARILMIDYPYDLDSGLARPASDAHWQFVHEDTRRQTRINRRLNRYIVMGRQAGELIVNVNLNNQSPTADYHASLVLRPKQLTVYKSSYREYDSSTGDLGLSMIDIGMENALQLVEEAECGILSRDDPEMQKLRSRIMTSEDIMDLGLNSDELPPFDNW